MSHIFISHATTEDETVAALREVLELQKELTWVDSRQMTAGDLLSPEMAQAIKEARHFVVVLSIEALGSTWVQAEVELALEVQKERSDGYKVIPILLPGLQKTHLNLLALKEVLAILVEDTPTGLAEAIPKLFEAIGQQLPRDWKPGGTVEAEPVEELILKLSDPTIVEQEGGVRRATARAELVYEPSNKSQWTVTSRRFTLTAPIGLLEQEEIRWYIEEYFRWPAGTFKERATRIENQLPEWGEALYQAALSGNSTREPFEAWSGAGGNRRFSIEVDFEPPEGIDKEAGEQMREASRDLLALPWEIMHDGRGYLFQGGNGVRVRRRLPNHRRVKTTQASLPIRILLVSPRPEVNEEGEPVGYFDHRSSALPVVEATENLGVSVVEVQVLRPPTFTHLKEALQKAEEDKKPIHLVHFDGHGMFDKRVGLGALCFEHPKDVHKPGQRRLELVHAAELAAELRGFGVPLVYLDACQTAQTDQDPHASVAAKLLEEGVGSVIAMSHTVLVETARRFVEPFYCGLAEGKRVGTAMRLGQETLYGNKERRRAMGGGHLALQDWFVPVLFQEKDDPQLFTVQLGEAAAKGQEDAQQQKLAHFPPPPNHHFVGRSRELLYLERLLQKEQYAVLRGGGGFGKTALAQECVRWLLRSGQFKRAVFVSVEFKDVQSVDAVMQRIGMQLLPEYTVQTDGWLPLERALLDFPTLILFDNMESLLPAGANDAEAAENTQLLLELCQKLMKASNTCRLLFTSREKLPAPFNQAKNVLDLPRMQVRDAIELVERVLAEKGWEPPKKGEKDSLEKITHLVETLQCHPRALVKLVPLLKDGGSLKATTTRMAELMEKLEAQNPNDRENSLYASVELSLQRLPEAIREKIKPLAVVHDGVDAYTMHELMGVEDEERMVITAALIQTGLAEMMEYSYLRLDPALGFYLRIKAERDELETWEAVWLSTMTAIVGFLGRQQFDDAQLARQLTVLQFPNIMALLDHLEKQLRQNTEDAEKVIDVATDAEQLFAALKLKMGLVKAIELREQAAKKMPEWNHAQFINRQRNIERLLDQGNGSQALKDANTLLQTCLSQGIETYQGADYDLALSYFLNGRVKNNCGLSEQGLNDCIKARELFESLGERGVNMASTAMTEAADCLLSLGRLEEAARLYQEAIQINESRDNLRSVAVGKAQLGTLRRMQKKYHESIEAYEECLVIFQKLKEPLTVATIWHQMGLMYYEKQDFETAEKAFRESLAIKTREGNLSGQADTLSMLGILYNNGYENAEQALVFYQRAATIYEGLGDKTNSGRVYNNIANILLKMNKLQEALRAAKKAVQYKQGAGFESEPWTSQSLLSRIETALGNRQEAQETWHEARGLYLAYRHQGGYARHKEGQLADHLIAALQEQSVSEVVKELKEVSSSSELSDNWRKFIQTLIQILQGSRDRTLADDMALNYNAAAEILYFIERLEQLEQQGKLKP